MAVICEQVYKELSMSGSGSKPDSIEQTYLVVGVPDEMEARRMVMEKSPSTLEGCPRTNVELDKHEGLALYFRVCYAMDSGSTSTSSDAEEETVSFDLTQSSITQKQAFQQKKYGAEAPDAGLAIGWNGKSGDGCEVAGVEIPVSSIKKSYTRIMTLSKLTVAWERKIAGLFGSVNSTAWKGYQPGEVLFLGCTYSGVNSRKTQFNVTFNFAVSFNEKDVTVGRDVSGKEIKVDKTGWEYIWSITRPAFEGNGEYQVMKIMGVYVSTVYRVADFKILGL